MQSWTVRKYTLPDKHVASQVLMYRQLLHTACRPGLTLSRPYQGTPAQQAVLDMPWWTNRHQIVETGKMVISYQNLLARLWISGALKPYGETVDLLMDNGPNSPNHESQTTKHAPAFEGGSTTTSTAQDATDLDSTAALKQGQPGHPRDTPHEEKKDVDETEAAQSQSQPSGPQPFRAPVPHSYWVTRLGFQQDDPVTDFRSGGILSLALLVHLVESCPVTVVRFVPGGEASVLPLALTCINITDMMAKFLMLSKTVDRMDALLSQKPFWRMFANPHALLVCHEVAMDLVAIVVVELSQKRQVTVFDFAYVMEIVEERMEYDYFMAGPTTVEELRQIHKRNTLKYKQEQEAQALQRQQEQEAESTPDSMDPTTATSDSALDASRAQLQEAQPHSPSKQRLQAGVQVLKQRAASVAGTVWHKVQETTAAASRGSRQVVGNEEQTDESTVPTQQPEENPPAFAVQAQEPSTFWSGVEDLDDADDVDL